MPEVPNPVRTLPSTAVVVNVSACTNIGQEHEMVSQKMGDETSVRFIERCVKCAWIDGASLQWWVEHTIKNTMAKRAQRIAVAAETEPFSFVQHTDVDLTLEEILFQALGAASMCWVGGTGDLEFDSSRAQQIGVAMMREVNRALRLAVERSHAEEVAAQVG